uniref:Uncharacterized protein n=1 Tax=Inonotus obliquus TaxID=167356 RepID=A0A5A4UBF2_9AGAM|nr:hypothetical protein [Inonotus obliquus]BBN21268.1 hypothetical protein [Inonotus obliquus]
MVKLLNVNSLNRNKKIKFISKFSTKTASTLFTQKPHFKQIARKNKLTNKKSYGFCLMLSFMANKEMFVINGTRAFHSSAVVNFKTPNFIKNILSRNDSPSISASTASSTSDSENGSKAINFWVSFVGLFSNNLADKIAYNRINKRRVNEWRNDVAEAQEENNQSSSNNNSNSNNNNNNNNNVNYNNSNIISNNTNNNNNIDNINNNNNYNINNTNSHIDSSSDYNDSDSDSGGDFGE